MSKSITRREFIAAASAAALAAALPACAKQAGSATPWTFSQDDDLPVLCMEVSGGAVVAMPGDGWKQQDGWIQLQLSGGSIPEKKIEAVRQEGDALIVALEATEGDVETMDLLLTEHRLEGGDAGVARVVVEQNGKRSEAQRDESEV